MKKDQESEVAGQPSKDSPTFSGRFKKGIPASAECQVGQWKVIAIWAPNPEEESQIVTFYLGTQEEKVECRYYGTYNYIDLNFQHYHWTITDPNADVQD